MTDSHTNLNRTQTDLVLPDSTKSPICQSADSDADEGRTGVKPSPGLRPVWNRRSQRRHASNRGEWEAHFRDALGKMYDDGTDKERRRLVRLQETCCSVRLVKLVKLSCDWWPTCPSTNMWPNRFRMKVWSSTPIFYFRTSASERQVFKILLMYSNSFFCYMCRKSLYILTRIL